MVRGYGKLPHAAYLLLHVRDQAAARGLVARLGGLGGDTRKRLPGRPGDAGCAHRDRVWPRWPAGRRSTWGFAEPFATGMATTYRSRLLGDVGANDPAAWDWGGPRNVAVDVAVLVYADTATRLAELHRSHRARPRGAAASTSSRRWRRRSSRNESTSGSTTASRSRVSPAREKTRAPDRAAEGRGHPGRRVRPRLRQRVRPAHRATAAAADRWTRTACCHATRTGRAPRISAATAATWCSGSSARTSRLRGVPGRPGNRRRPGGRPASRVPGGEAGRAGGASSGAPLALAPHADDPALEKANDFGYHRTDPDGLGCPIGAHVRRTNPRDALPPQPGTAASRAVNVRHRLLRRGRGYGPTGPGRRRTRAALPVPGHQPGAPVRVRAAQLDQRPVLQRPRPGPRTRSSALA